MKKCQEIGCENNIFGGGYCKYHQFRRHMAGGDKFKRTPRQKSVIPKESKKRAKDNRLYLVRVKEFWEEAVKSNTNYCIFCGEKMNKREDNHHISGRGKYFLDEKLWSHAHRECHDNYHHKSIEWLMKQPWWTSFLNRMRIRDSVTYRKLLAKIEKSENLFGND